MFQCCKIPFTGKVTFFQINGHGWRKHYRTIVARSISIQSVHLGKKKPDYADHLPVYDYGTVNLESKRLYVFGSARCIGLPFLIKSNDSSKRQRLYTQKPVRNEFAYYNPVYDIAAGPGFTLLAIKPHSTNAFHLFGSGVNESSQIGYQSVRPNSPMELILSFVPITLPISYKPKILCMTAGQSHSLVSVEGQGVFSFGDNSFGQCGRFVIPDEKYFGSRIVHKIKMEIPEDIVTMCSRVNTSICITRSGQVFTFGYNHKGQLGRGKLVPGFWTPDQVKGDLQGEQVTSAATSGDSVLCVTEKGQLFAWGCNEWGQIDPYNSACVYYEPRNIKLPPSFGKIKSVAMGDGFAFILNEIGEVYVWGHGNALGVGPETKIVKKPTIIPPPLFGKNEFNFDCRVTNISASYTFAAAVNSDGDLYTWGENHQGCLGLKTMPSIQSYPLKVSLGGAVHKVALGVDHTVVLCKGGF